MLIAIYCRVSTEEQAKEGYSLAAQERFCRDYAEKQGFSVAKVYIDDGYTGRNEHRPALQRLIADLNCLGIQKVVFYDLDRFARNLRLQLNLKAELDARGVALVSLNDRIDTSTPEGILEFQMKGMLSEWFSNQLSRKVKHVLQDKVEQGGFNGPVPLGYMRDAQSNLVFSNDRPLVIHIFERYATGVYSYKSLAAELNAAGCMTLYKGKQRPFQKDTIRTIVANRVYLGMVRYKRGVWKQGKHEAMIDRGLWDRVEAIRARRLKCQGGRIVSVNSTGLLSEIAYCARCGEKLHWQNKRDYWCSRRRRFGDSACNAPMIRGENIEPMVLDVVKALTLPAVIRDAVIAEVHRRLEYTPDNKTDNVATLRKQIARLGDRYELGDFSKEVYLQRRAAIEQRIADVSTKQPVMLEIDRAMKLLSDIPTLLEKATHAQQRALIQQLFECVWIEKLAVAAIRPTASYVLLIELLADQVALAISAGLEPTTFSSGG